MWWLMLQAALEGALSALANIAGLSSDAQQSAHKNGLLGVLVSCLQQASNGAAHISANSILLQLS